MSFTLQRGLASLVLFSGIFATASPASAFQKCLITGASISGNHGGVKSPGQLYCEAQSLPLIRVAVPGHTSADIAPRAKLALEQAPAPKPDLILAVDLFFWDSVDPTCAPKRVPKFIETAQALAPGSTLVIGNVPVHGAAAQPCRIGINQALSSSCTAEAHCLILDLEKLPNRPEYYQDALHLSLTGSQVVAQAIQQLLK